MTSCSPVATARTPPRGSGSSRLRAIRSPVTGPSSPSPRTSTGDRQKRSSTRWDLSAGPRAANSRSMSMFRRVVGEASPDSSHTALEGSSSSFARVDDDVGARQVAELAQLRVRERRLRRPAAAEDDHFRYRRGGERRDRMVGGVGPRELVRIEHQHSGDVDRDVPVADHDGALARQVERRVGVRRVTVVPGDELGGGDRPGAAVARDSQPVVGRRSHRVDDGVIAVEQVLRGHVDADLHTAEEAERRVLRGLLVHPRDRLDLRVVGSDAGAHEPVGRRQRVEQVDRDARLQQLVGGVEAGRAGPDDRYTGRHRRQGDRLLGAGPFGVLCRLDLIGGHVDRLVADRDVPLVVVGEQVGSHLVAAAVPHAARAVDREPHDVTSHTSGRLVSVIIAPPPRSLSSSSVAIAEVRDHAQPLLDRELQLAPRQVGARGSGADRSRSPCGGCACGR